MKTIARGILEDLKLQLDTLEVTVRLHDTAVDHVPDTPNQQSRNVKLVDDLGDFATRLCGTINEDVQRFLDATEAAS